MQLHSCQRTAFRREAQLCGSRPARPVGIVHLHSNKYLNGEAQSARRCRAKVLLDKLPSSSNPEPPARVLDVPTPPLTATTTSAGTLPSIWARTAVEFAELPALDDPHHPGAVKLTHRELYEAMQDFAAGLQELGVAKHDKVALLAENSHRWLVADQGVMLCGAADVVRGSTAPADELAYIVGHSGAVGACVQDAAALEKLLAGAQHLKASGDASFPGLNLRFVVVLWGGAPTSGPAEAQRAAAQAAVALGCPVLSYEEVAAAGAARRQAAGGFQPVPVSPQDLATLVYTSGTTGHPKGVMLTHSNLVYQVQNLSFFIQLRPGERVLSLLPPWHIYERTCSYFVLSKGLQQVYSSIRKLRDDLPLYHPDHFVCVPLVLDTLYTRVMQKLQAGSALRAAIAKGLLAASTAYVRAQRVVQGVALRYAGGPAAGGGGAGAGAGGGALRNQPRGLAELVAATLLAALLRPLHALGCALVYGKIREAIGIRSTVISGGGSLAAHLDDFYEVIGLPVLNGWGLTETSPVLACRRATEPLQNVRGSVGLPTPGTELRCVDPDSLVDLPAGRQGLLLARGPGLMAGYYRDEAATAKAFRAGGGWFDTGDLGWVAPEGVPGSCVGGHVTLTGRAKDTIVLSNGKNVEPQPIEDAVQACPLIKYAVLVGQDKRELGALLWPDEDALKAAGLGGEAPGAAERLADLLAKEVDRLNSSRPDYHPFDHIAHVAVVRAPLSADEGTLTRTLKPRRQQIMQRYAEEAGRLLHHLRG